MPTPADEGAVGWADKLPSPKAFAFLLPWTKGSHRVNRFADALLVALVEHSTANFGRVGDIRSTLTGQEVKLKV